MALDSWKQQLAQSYRTPEALRNAGLINATEAAALVPVFASYAFRLTPYYAGLIDRGDKMCPIRLQAIPQAQELDQSGAADPLGDLSHQPAPRITHRYPNRVLFHLTANCSLYCRYCFRKSLLTPEDQSLFRGTFDEALTYVGEHTEIEEVIFSGGDPLLVPDATLTNLVETLDGIRHVQRIRFHTRVPVTLPQRIDSSLIRALEGPKPRVIVSHFNHPREVTPEARQALKNLSPFTRLNQSVLLKGVNASAETLGELSRALFRAGALPYYLHHPDPARGTSHFWVDREEGWKIYSELRRHLSGYLVPRYVVETGDAAFKPLVVETLESSPYRPLE